MNTTAQHQSPGQWSSDHPCPNGCDGFPFGVLDRPRYFPRQLITPDELSLEAAYFRDRLRRHNRYLHGWGVVCGALVCVVPAAQASNGNGPPATRPWVVRVQPGYILGPYGDEIVIDCEREVPLRGERVRGCGGAVDDLTDPWCSEVYVKDRKEDEPLYVAVRYLECQVRPVLAQPAGCGCDDTSCEYSRYHDGYELCILDHCPDTHTMGKPDDDAARRNPLCPGCPDSPWVVLAEVTVDGDGTVTKIDNCACRRIVVSARDYWLKCEGTDQDYPPRQQPAQPAPAAEEPGGAAAEPAADRPTPRRSPRRRGRATAGEAGERSQ
jgi:hypothetical protein